MKSLNVELAFISTSPAFETGESGYSELKEIIRYYWMSFKVRWAMSGVLKTLIVQVYLIY